MGCSDIGGTRARVALIAATLVWATACEGEGGSMSSGSQPAAGTAAGNGGAGAAGSSSPAGMTGTPAASQQMAGAGGAAMATANRSGGAAPGGMGMPGMMAGVGVAPQGGTGATQSTQVEDSGAAGDPQPLPDLTPSADPIPLECQGFPLEGLMESPGGDVLPNKCAPFHPTWNNPYAVLCVHAWPWYDTGFPGDEFCILPPPRDKGIQVGFHPMEGDYFAQVSSGDMSGYATSDPDWVLPPGGENTRNYIAPADNAEEHSYYRTYFRMRTGSHHNIITLHAPDPEYAWLPTLGDSLPGLFDLERPVAGVLGGQQRPDDSTPVTFEKPAEDAGLYLRWPAEPSVLYNLHYFNTTDETVLKEGWVNVWWEEDAEVLVNWYMGLPLEQTLLLSVPPGDVQDYHYVWDIISSVRLLRVFGHRHAWTSNFSTWLERADGSVELIYQSHDWQDMPTYRYDSVVENPSPDPDGKIDGASSGVLELQPGDRMHFNCHIEFTQERAAAEHAPDPYEIGTLGFANQAYTGEMCIQFGNVAGDRIGSPVASSEPVPDFATK